MDNFNFNLFKYFYYVVTFNGFTNASKQLSVAQSSLSMSIKKLEEDLSKGLIDRSCGKKFKLTRDGENLFQILKPMFENLEKNINFIPGETRFNELNIGIRFSYAKSILSNFIFDFRLKYPNIKLNIDVYSKLDFSKVNNKEYDIIIDDDVYINQLENVTIESLCSLKNYFICGIKLFDSYVNVNELKSLDCCNLISYRPSLKNGKFQEFCYNNNVTFIEIMSINESDLYFKLIQNNYGIGFSNLLLIKEYLKKETIKVINIKDEIFIDKISIAYTKKDITITDFASMLKEKLIEELK